MITFAYMIKTDDTYIFELRMRVRDYEVDSQGIVNNANYLHYMEHTRHEFCRKVGTTFRDMQARGIDPVLRRVDIEYVNPLRLGEEMISCLNICREGARFVFNQAIFRYVDGALSARARVEVVCLEDGRLTRGDQLAEAFSKYL